MRLCITASGADRDTCQLEERLRLLLGSWSCRIRSARVEVEDVQRPRAGPDVRCAINASLIPTGSARVQGLGADVETALRAAARRLVRRVMREFYRDRIGVQPAELNQ